MGLGAISENGDNLESNSGNRANGFMSTKFAAKRESESGKLIKFASFN